MVERQLKEKYLYLLEKFPVVVITGPRQSGKTTFIKNNNKGLPYVTIEDPDIRQLATEDPRGFLNNYPKGAIIDEVQNVPELFSYIQGIVDTTAAKFVLSGSQNFLLLEKITQSLAGRSALLRLLPFSMKETKKYGEKSLQEYIFNGFYPRIYDKEITATDFYPNYINTYLQRDVRLIKNIENLALFTKFLTLCAGRIGQLLNVNSLASDVGVSPNTVSSWLSVLEASYIVYFLQPHHKNFNKRVVKSPKLYFYDTGVACSLLGISSPQQLSSHYLIGGLFENFVVNEFFKTNYNKGVLPNYYFWQNKTKKEIDLIEDQGDKLIPYEIKAGKTLKESYFTNLKYWQKLTGEKSENLNVIYGGEKSLAASYGNYVSWKSI